MPISGLARCVTTAAGQAYAVYSMCAYTYTCPYMYMHMHMYS